MGQLRTVLGNIEDLFGLGVRQDLFRSDSSLGAVVAERDEEDGGKNGKILHGCCEKGWFGGAGVY